MDAALWREILTEALGAAGPPPVLGTTLRPQIARVAEARGTTFPPADEPELRLGQLVDRFPETVAVRRRAGRDMLVVLADQRELLGDGEAGGQLSGLRADLFEAFTRIRNEAPFYDKAGDTVIWAAPGATPDGTIPMPRASFERETEVRRMFAASIPDEDVRARLEVALEGKYGLSTFSNEVRANKLQRTWHQFRTARLREWLHGWADSSKLAFRDDWFGDRVLGGRFGGKALPAARGIDTESLVQLLSHLRADDLARIKVPLDIVARVARELGLGERG